MEGTRLGAAMFKIRIQRHQKRERACWPVLFLAALILLPGVLMTSACTSNRMHRPPPWNIQQEAGYTLAFIEFDDEGELWSPKQRESVVDLIKRKNETEAGVVLFVFFHGWNNNASEKDEQNKKQVLYGFKDFMSKVAYSVRDFYSERPPGGGESLPLPHVVAVYIGWRGRSAHQPFKAFTFYSRRKAAGRIASGPTVSEVLLDLINTAKENPDSKTIVIGHSFGAMLLEQAIAQILVGEVMTSDEGDTLEVPIDLVLLFNEAAPALLARQLVEVFARHRIKVYQVDYVGNRAERPLLISITSTADWATRFAYPIGNAFGAAFRRFRKYGSEHCSPGAASQKEYYKRTAGHVPALHTHIVTAKPLPKGAQPAEGVHIEFDADSGRRTVSFDGEKNNYTIRPSPRSFNDTPYWIMQVPASMSNSHNDIFNFDTERLLRALFLWTGTSLRKTKTVLVRETGVSPIGLTTHPVTGELVFTDRSRRLYTVHAGSSKTVFLACTKTDYTSFIGSFSGPEAVFIVNNREILKKGKPVRYETEMRRVKVFVAELELEVSPPFRIAGSQRFFAATGDAERQKVYLTTQDAIYVADVAADSPAPRRLTGILGIQLRRLVVDTARQRLFALDSAVGRVFLIDLGKSAPQATLVADGLGKASDIGIDRRTGMVYVVNAETQQVWQLACKAGGCTKQIFAHSDAFKRPFRLEITRDGTVWVADAKAKRIFGLDPDGSIRHIIDSLD